MKITFTFLQIIGILLFISICFWLLPMFYDAWMFPKYNKYGNLTPKSGWLRVFSVIYGFIVFLIYLGPMGGDKHLVKKRSITLKKPF